MFKHRKEPLDVFTLTLPLNASILTKSTLDKVFRCANKIKNELIAYAMNNIKQMERTREWRNIQFSLAEAYTISNELTKNIRVKTKDYEKAPRGYRDLGKEIRELNTQLKKNEAQIKALLLRRNEMIVKNNLTVSQLESRVQHYRKAYHMLIQTHIAQRLAGDVSKAVEAYLYGNGEKLSFSKWTEFTSIYGKAEGDIKFIVKDMVVKLGKGKRRISIPVGRTNDKYGYEDEALMRSVRYCGIIRKWYPNGWTYFLQIYLEGKPPVKINPQTGEVLQPLGKGRVGHDIGPQTLATVGDKSTNLCVLAENVQSIDNKLRLINRAMDRSRRATNPRMFNDKGEIVRIDYLPPECVNKYGKRKWVKSKRYVKLEARRRYLYRLQAEQRTQAHNELANKLIAFGDIHFIEKMNFSALAKRAKKTEVSEKTGRMKRKKRFGKSIANKAPAEFVNILEKKVISQGGSFYRINTAEAKASQYDHKAKAYKKKHLSQRWHVFDDGSKVQRDLYSAFLLQNTNDTLDGFIQESLKKKFNNFVMLHDKTLKELETHTTVSSMGIQKAG